MICKQCEATNTTFGSKRCDVCYTTSDCDLLSCNEQATIWQGRKVYCAKHLTLFIEIKYDMKTYTDITRILHIITSNLQTLI